MKKVAKAFVLFILYNVFVGIITSWLGINGIRFLITYLSGGIGFVLARYVNVELKRYIENE